MRTGIYIRVSTQEQALEGYSIGAQTDRLKLYCSARDWTVYKIYTDGGFSGSNIERPAMSEMLADIKKGRLDMVLVYKLDRLSRSQKDTLYLIEDVFLKNDVGFVSMNENFDTSSPFGRAMIGILSVFAQLEREQIKERMSMGRAERAKVGLYHGGGHIPIGYDYVDGQLIINEYEAMQIRLMFDMFLQGKSYHAIRQHLNEHYTVKTGNWSSTTSVNRSLKQILYAGKIERNGKIFDGQHEAIVSMDTFNQAQARIKVIRESPWSMLHQEKNKNPQSLLTGMLFCGHCGARYFKHQAVYVYKEKREPRLWYKCYSRHGSPAHMVKDHSCKNKTYKVEELDTIILNEIKQLAFDESYLDRLTVKREVEDSKPILKKRIAEIDTQISRVMDLYQLGNATYDQIESRIKSLSEEKENLIHEIESGEAQEQPMTIGETKSLLDGAIEIINNGSFKEQRTLVASLINKIIIDDEDATIYWSFA